MKKVMLLLAAIGLLSTVCSARDLKIGIASGARAMDPYFQNETTTNSVLSNIFDALIFFDKDINTHPGLAVSWTNPEPKVWILKLRKGVKFHNGNIFNADDVIYSFDRVINWEKSGFKSVVSMIDSFSKIDDYTVKFVTKKPFPIFLRKLTYVYILDKETVEDKTNEWIALNPVGTGPYKLVTWRKGDLIQLTAYADHWRGQPAFDRVMFRPLTNNATRVAAILSGEVDIINRVPVVDVPRVKRKDNLTFYVKPGLRLIFLQMDQFREDSPHIKSPTGKNPFMDVRVRKAIFHGINEDAIVKYVMKDFAVPAAQFNPDVVYGYDPAIKRPAYNPEKAKRLLAEAGYPNGFEVRLDSPNNRYINDAQIAQAVASSLAKIGIKVSVNATPKSTFWAENRKLNTSFFLMGWASADGDASSILDIIIHSFDGKKGFGNRGRYSNAAVDELIDTSSGIMDPEKRLTYLKKAQRIALVDQQCIIPLHYQVDLYAFNKKVHFEPRTDSRIWAFDIK